MWSREIRILLVAGQSAIAEELHAALSQQRDNSKRPVRFHTDQAPTAQAAIDLLQKIGYDTILLDLRPHPGKKIQDIARIRQATPTIPLIALLDDPDEKTLTAVENAGADECFTRTSFSLIPHALRFLAGRRRAEQHFDRTELDFRMLIQHSTDITTLLDSDAHVRYISPSVTSTLGYTPDELRNVVALDFVHPDDLNHVRTRLARALTHPGQRTTSEVRFRHKDGSWVPLEIAGSAVPYEAGKLQLIVNARDITSRWLAEEASRNSEQQFRTIFENSPDAMFVEDLNGRVLDVNTAACWLHGLPREKIIGKSVLELVPPDEHDAVLRDFPQIVAGKIKKLEGESLTTDGRIIPIELTVSRIHYAGQPAMLLNVRDISERKHAEAAQRKMEEDLRQMQKLDSIGRLAEGIAHDFNNIISVVQGHADLALHDPTISHHTQESLRQICKAADRAGNLTRQLLTFSRKQVVEKQTVDLNQVVTGFSKMLSRVLGERISLVCQPASTPAWVQADTGMIEQILLNLVVNARDATSEGGQVTVSISPALPDAGPLRQESATARNDYFCLSVTDTGGGIPTEILPRIFEPFFTTKEQGESTGLGLSAVYGIVKQHKGWVDVDSSPGHGTTFKIYLPASSKPAAAPESAPAPADRQTILVLESDRDIRESATAVLRGEGFRVLEANSGLQALELSNHHNPKTDLIITNLALCNSSNGHDVIEELQAGNPDLKVILINGINHSNGNGNGKHPNGHKDFVPANSRFLDQPFDTHTLCDAVHQTLQIK